MIRGKKYYFFLLERIPDDQYPQIRIAESLEDLRFRFGDIALRQFLCITELGEVTMEHIIALELFLNQNLQ